MKPRAVVYEERDICIVYTTLANHLKPWLLTGILTLPANLIALHTFTKYFLKFLIHKNPEVVSPHSWVHPHKNIPFILMTVPRRKDSSSIETSRWKVLLSSVDAYLVHPDTPWMHEDQNFRFRGDLLTSCGGHSNLDTQLPSGGEGADKDVYCYIHVSNRIYWWKTLIRRCSWEG